MRKFHRKTADRRAFLQGLIHNLIMRNRIETTVARAKEIRPLTEKLVTHAKRQDLASLRYLIQRLPKQSAMKLYHEVAPKYKERKGGYIRIHKMMGVRKRDAAPKAMIEFV